jgi:hypothetical protein
MPIRVAIDEIPDDRKADLMRLGKVSGAFLVIPTSHRKEYEAAFRRIRGLGDLVEVFAAPVARALRIKKCRGCNSRKRALNKAVPL